MAARILHSRHLSLRERQALSLLRAGDALRANADIVAAFGALRRCATSAGLVLFAVESPIVHQDEKRLLAWLALHQRRMIGNASSGAFATHEQLQRALQECAHLLDRAGIHIEYRAAIRQGAPVPALQNRVLQAVSEKGSVATHDLNALGASNSVIGAMRKKGLLRRVSHGLYAAGQRGRSSGSGLSAAAQPALA